MKAFRRFVLALGLASASLGVYAQSDNPYIDDAYLSQKDLEVREAKARAAAEARYREALEQQKRYEAEQEKYLEAYKARQRDREIDAYNGRLSVEEDSRKDELQQYEQVRPSGKGSSTEIHIYGPYSERLARFHSDGTMIVTSPGVYLDRDYYSGGRTTLSLHLGSSSWYPWYDSFYPSAYFYDSYYYRPRHWYRYGGRWGWHPYDAFYFPHYSPYYDSWAWGYSSGYYGGLYSYYDGYYRGLADRAYTDHYYRNPYAHGSRSGGRYYSSGVDRSSYGAYRSASSGGYERSYGTASYSGGSYSGGSRSGGSYSGSSSRSYGGSTRYQGAARLPQESQSRGSYTPQSSSSSNSYERSYSGSSSSSSSTRSYSSPSASSSSPSRGSGIRARHR